MFRGRKRLLIAGLAVLACFVLVSCTSLREVSGFPARLRVSEGETFVIKTRLPFSGVLVVDPPDSVLVHGSAPGDYSVTPTRSGRTSLELRLFNVIPIRRLVVEIIPELRVIPGGHSVGILLANMGVSVMGLYPVQAPDGSRRFPARDAGIDVGDIILSINGEPVTDSDDLERLVDEAARAGSSVEARVRRGSAERTVTLDPAPSGPGYRIGVYVRDNAAGVGTLTFWDPVTMQFGALGHVVTDVHTGREVSITDGRIVSARVAGIEVGGAGRPGEKIGTFGGTRDYIGTILGNSGVGIFGTLSRPLPNPLYTDPIPVALASSVREGPAEILTVISGSEIERFSVEIVRVTRQTRPTGKGLVVRVTDRRLLAKTGGIVQGMSGSPIIQDGKLIGAVTHVFVSDPARGYGVFAEHMVDTARTIAGPNRLGAGIRPQTSSKGPYTSQFPRTYYVWPEREADRFSLRYARDGLRGEASAGSKAPRLGHNFRARKTLSARAGDHKNGRARTE
ncbi:MAG: SpoIVB peptidase [Firmicutes bacterium]|jgi:stage IV sporulation protein B|nr:SpoIVB peptidase [Bacillota bacterium]